MHTLSLAVSLAVYWCSGGSASESRRACRRSRHALMRVTRCTTPKASETRQTKTTGIEMYAMVLVINETSSTAHAACGTVASVRASGTVGGGGGHGGGARRYMAGVLVACVWCVRRAHGVHMGVACAWHACGVRVAREGRLRGELIEV